MQPTESKGLVVEAEVLQVVERPGLVWPHPGWTFARVAVLLASGARQCVTVQLPKDKSTKGSRVYLVLPPDCLTYTESDGDLARGYRRQGKTLLLIWCLLLATVFAVLAFLWQGGEAFRPLSAGAMTISLLGAVWCVVGMLRQ